MNERQPASPGFTMAVDYAPLGVFFLVNFLTPGLPIVRVVAATVAFMVATVIAMVVSRIRTGRIAPMLWMSGVLVLVFGGLTVYFHDEAFIKMKPTIVYAMLAAILGFGLATGRPLLQSVLGNTYPGLSEEGWRKVTRNWALFFVFMACLNEIVWRSTSWNVWVSYKLFGAIPLTLAFALANIPMLLRHGLTTGGEIANDLPPEA